jgi:hypothetical protein
MTRWSPDNSKPSRSSWPLPLGTPHWQRPEGNISDDFSRALAQLRSDALRRLALRQSHFNPNQPRVPAGNPDGGQWTRGGWIAARRHLTDGGAHSTSLPPGLVLTDERPYPTRVWSQYAQAGSDNARDPAIERTR